MTEREISERVLTLCEQADGLRLPSHRVTAEQAYAGNDAIRNGLRRLYRDLTGEFPAAGTRRSGSVPPGQEGRIRAWRA